MCGILGIISKTNNIPIKMYEGLTYLQHRGQDSSGICNEKFCIKNNGTVKDVFDEKKLDNLKSDFCIGHVRYRTAGSFTKNSIQPLIIESNETRISLSHNGNITNLEYIENIIGKKNNMTDSMLLLELFYFKFKESQFKKTYENIFDIVEFIIKNITGSYSVLIIIKDFGMITFRDRFGIRPLVYGINNSDYIISSESVVVDILGFDLIRDVKPGEIILFEKDRYPRFHIFNNSSLYPCLFEYIYFARIDSVLNGISIYEARYKLGKLLGEKIKRMEINDIDMIIPVPDTSLIFGLGLQEELNVNLKYGLVKNSYIDRTFIMKDDKIINKSIKRKLNLVKNIIANKNILIVDDSVVRGNTSKHIVQLAKNAGAKKVYMASGAPPILFPNKYGIFIESKKELIAVDRTFKDIADIIGCNEIIYNDLDEIINCLIDMNNEIKGFETSMFNDVHLFD